jgi:Tol biopolymer transport system component
MFRHLPAGLAAALVLAACTPDAPTGATADASSLARVVTYTDWAPAINVEQIPGTASMFNTPAAEGCPFIAPDGRTFFMASNRPGGLGGLDIWVSRRESTDDPWGAPVNVGAPVNSEYNDFCPTLARDGHTFFFASSRPGGCGGDDLYTTRFHDDGSIDAPENLGCQVNSAGNEAGPSYITEPGTGPVLYFSSTRAGGPGVEAPGALTGDADIYRSKWHGGAFDTAALVPGINSEGNEGQPNLERDGREIYFFSNRPGTLGGNDIYAATRASAHQAWSAPFNLGPNVNGGFDETRPSLSWDARTLYFGSNRPPELGSEGSNDIFVTTRRPE